VTHGRPHTVLRPTLSRKGRGHQFNLFPSPLDGQGPGVSGHVTQLREAHYN